MDQNDTRLIKVRGAIAKYGISRSTLYKWLGNGTIEGVKLGRATYIIVASLERAISLLPAYRPPPPELPVAP